MRPIHGLVGPSWVTEERLCHKTNVLPVCGGATLKNVGQSHE